jgi:hypothetical protein
MYRPPAASSRSGPGISKEGYEGAESFFEQAKHLAGELHIPGVPGGSSEVASAKAAVDAYMAARNGMAGPTDTYFQHGRVPGEFPQVDLKADVATGSPLGDIGKAVGDLMSHMGDMVNQLVQGPMGMLGSILSFLMKLFTEVASSIGQALSETAQAVASAVEDAWKKQMEMASTAGNSGLQPLELYNQSATTQTLSHALKNTSST